MPPLTAGDPEPTRVQGYCPMGCGATLERAPGGVLTCTAADCPNRYAAATILEDQEFEHVVHFDGDGFTIRHPLRERINDELLDCVLHEVCHEMYGPPDGGTGSYRPRRVEGHSEHSQRGWAWEAIEA